MTEYTRATVMQLIVERLPGFEPRWAEHLDYWEGEPAGLTNDMAELSLYAQALLEAGDASDELPRLFAMAEDILVNGDEPAKDAIATSFLENTVNVLEPDTPKAQRFSQLLGAQSRAFCLEWDAFSGGQLSELLKG